MNSVYPDHRLYFEDPPRIEENNEKIGETMVDLRQRLLGANPTPRVQECYREYFRVASYFLDSEEIDTGPLQQFLQSFPSE